MDNARAYNKTTRLDSNFNNQDMRLFLRNPHGYITIDLTGLRQISEHGLDQFLKAAAELKDTKGSLQFVNADRNGYVHLMNTNILGRRLISLAEIYTHRTDGEIAHNLNSILDDCDLFNVDKRILIETRNRSSNEYESKHQSVLNNESYKH